MSTHHGFSSGEWNAWSTAKRDEVAAAIKAGTWKGVKTTPPGSSPSAAPSATSPPSTQAPAQESTPAPPKKQRTAADSPPSEDPRDYMMKKMIDSHPGFNPSPAGAPVVTTGTTASFTPTPQGAQQQQAPAPPLTTSREEDLRLQREREDRERKDREAREAKDREDKERREREEREKKEKDRVEALQNQSDAGMKLLASKFDQLLDIEKTRSNEDIKKEKAEAIKREDESRALLKLIAERLDPEKQPKKKKKDDDDDEDDEGAAEAREKKKRRKQMGPFADVAEQVEEETKAKLAKAIKGGQFQWDAPTIGAVRDIVEDGAGGVAKMFVLQMRRSDRKEARLERKEERLFRKELALDFYKANGRMPTLREMSLLMGATHIPESSKEELEDKQEIEEVEEEILSNEAGAKLLGLAPPKEIAADSVPKVTDKPPAPASQVPVSPAEASLKAKLMAAQRSPSIGPSPPPPKPPAPFPPTDPDTDDDLEAALAKEESGKK